ncbi:hypothetical protein BBJ28_00024893 [Nothophytophthora sp. Chile5]|nr:hypothetical protein BBJ28_00024893 [Nothophytophthora sp. Chile5]
MEHVLTGQEPRRVLPRVALAGQQRFPLGAGGGLGGLVGELRGQRDGAVLFQGCSEAEQALALLGGEARAIERLAVAEKRRIARDDACVREGVRVAGPERRELLQPREEGGGGHEEWEEVVRPEALSDFNLKKGFYLDATRLFGILLILIPKDMAAADEDAAAARALLESFTAGLQSERAWRNVQGVLLESFGLVARLLAAQTQQIERLQRRLDAVESDVGAVRSETAASGVEQASAMEERVRVDVKRRVVRLRKELLTSLEQQAARQEAREEAKTAAQGQAEEMAKAEQSCQRSHRALEERIEQLALQSQLALETQRVQQEDLAANDREKLQQDALQQMAALEAKLEERATARESAAPQAVEGAAAPAGLETVRSSSLLEAWKQLAEKADSSRVEEMAGTLMDSLQQTQETLLDDLEQLRQLQNSKADGFELVQLKHNLHNVLSIAESLQLEFRALQRSLGEKMTVTDAQELLESQVTLHGLQEALSHAKAGEFATKPELEGVTRQVQGITRQLRSEIFQARYVSGAASFCGYAKQTIQWTSQVVNTNADIFLWQFGSDEVRLLLPGLYHLQTAVFTSYSPTLQVLVNGEPVLSLRSAKDEGVRRTRHSAGNLAGLPIDAFLALPARALVAISYDLDEKAQGFLNLRKL